jgi:hypothetical protein
MDFGFILTFILACYGGANGIVYSKLLSPIRLLIIYKSYALNSEGQVIEGEFRTHPICRFLAKLITCPLCVGFWLGVVFSLAGVGPMEYYTIAPWNIVMMFADGFVGSASAWILHLLLYDKMAGK